MKLPKDHKERAIKNTKADIANLMGFLECEMAKQPEDMDWARIGNLKHLRSNLLQALVTFSGISMHDVENILEDSRK